MDDKEKRHKLEGLSIGAAHTTPPEPAATVSSSSTAIPSLPPTHPNATTAATSEQAPDHPLSHQIDEYNNLEVEAATSDVLSSHLQYHNHEQCDLGPRMAFPQENFQRSIEAIVTEPDGNQPRTVLTVGLFDSGSAKYNIISARLARKLNLIPEQPSRGSRIWNKIWSIFNKKKRQEVEDICNGADGTRVRGQQGEVTVGWICHETPYTDQYLHFDPRAYYTKHRVVEGARADLIFSRRTWLELRLTEPSVSTLRGIILPKPKPNKGRLTFLLFSVSSFLI